MKTTNLLDSITLNVVYDNDSHDKRLKTDWGFSCLIEDGENTILFDTGGNHNILLDNMKRLGINIADINVVFVSHIHADHTGGLAGFLKKNSGVTVYLPLSFPESFKGEARDTGAKVVTVNAATEILPGIYSTGELGIAIKEQTLIVDTDKGLVIVTGCSHPGIVTIIERARELVPDKDIYLVIGGWHLDDASEDELDLIYNHFRKNKVIKVAPCHCSGEMARRFFQHHYKDDFISCGTGFCIDVSKD